MEEFSPEENQKIRVFLETYNALYLEDFSQEKLEGLKEELNPVYRKLIDNLKSPMTYAQYEYIEGPRSLYKFKMEADGRPKKSFYIFGEHHEDSKGHCGRAQNSIEFHQYLKSLSLESPSFLDVYVELSMVKSKYEYGSTRFAIPVVVGRMLRNRSESFRDSFRHAKLAGTGLFKNDSYTLTKIHETFSNCLQPALRNVPECELIRIHNIDIRDTWDNLTDDYGLSLLREIIDQATSMEEIINLIRRISLEIPLLSDTLRILATTRNLMDLLMMSEKLKNEIDLSYEKENITNFIQSKLDEFDRVYYANIARSLFIAVRNNTLPTDLTLDELKSVSVSFEDIDVLKMDMYALARIFKPYNIYRDNLLGSFQPVESKNVIVYVGNNHAGHYVQFFEYLATVGQDVLLSYWYISETSLNCVKINTNPKYYRGSNRFCGIQ
jgi:hypothetical protein